MEIFLLISYLSEIKIHYFLKIPESNKITLGVQRSMQIYDDGSITCRYVDRMRNNIKYCKPTFIRLQEIFLRFTRALLLQKFSPQTSICHVHVVVIKKLVWIRLGREY